MKNKYENKTNNEIKSTIKRLESDFLALKSNLLKGYDSLINIENECLEAINELKKRNKK